VRGKVTRFHAFPLRIVKPRRDGWRYNFLLRTNGAAPIESVGGGGLDGFPCDVASIFVPPMTDMPNHPGPAPRRLQGGGRAARRKD